MLAGSKQMLKNKEILLAVVLLIALGILIGGACNFFAQGDVFWPVFSAVGAWVGGLGAFYAAYIALGIANRQIERDSYRLEVYKELVFPEHPIRPTLLTPDPEMDADMRAFVRVHISNTGLRPIQIVNLHVVYKSYDSAIEQKEVLEPGCSYVITFESDEKIFRKALERDQYENNFDKKSEQHRIPKCFFFENVDLILEDATGMLHLVPKAPKKIVKVRSLSRYREESQKTST